MAAGGGTSQSLLLIEAAACGSIDAVLSLLADPATDPNEGHGAALTIAARMGHLHVVEALLSDPRVDAAVDWNAPIYAACVFGHAEIVDRLLRCAAVDPAACDTHGNCLEAAAAGGHGLVVALLLGDPRTNPYEDSFAAFHAAVRSGRLEVVDAFLSYFRVQSHVDDDDAEGSQQDRTLDSNLLLYEAIDTGSVGVVEQILAEKSWLHDSDWYVGAAALEHAAEAGRVDVFDRVLAEIDPDDDVDFYCELALVKACAHRRMDIVRHLLDRRDIAGTGVIPTELMAAAAALCAAVYAGDTVLLERLLADPSVDPNAALDAACSLRTGGDLCALQRLLGHPDVEIDEALRSAAEHGNVEAIAMIVNHPTLASDTEAARLKHGDSDAAFQAIAASLAAPDTIIKMLDILLAHPLADMGAMRVSFGFLDAVKWGNNVAALRLLQDHRVHSRAHAGVDEASGWLVAAAHCSAEVMGALAGRLGDISEAEMNAGFKSACNFGNASAMEWFIRDPRVDITAVWCKAMAASASSGSLPVLERLLSDPRVDPSSQAGDAVSRAVVNGHAHALARLLRDPRVAATASASVHGAVREAAAAGRLAVLDVLLTHLDGQVAAAAAALAGTSSLRAASLGGGGSVHDHYHLDRMREEGLIPPRIPSGKPQQPLLRRSGAVGGSREHAALARTGDEALVAAMRNAQVEAVQRLLADPFFVPQAFHVTEVLNTRMWDKTGRHIDAIRCLIAHPALPATPGSAADTALRTIITYAVNNRKRRISYHLLALDEARWILAEPGNRTIDRFINAWDPSDPQTKLEAEHERRRVLPTPVVTIALRSPLLQGATRREAAKRLRRLLSVDAIAEAAWARRRAVVLARAAALMPDSDHDDDSGEGRGVASSAAGSP